MTDLPTLRIEIRGMPHPQPRPRFVKGQGVVSTLAPRVKAWRLRLADAIATAALEVGEAEIERFHAGALALRLEFRIPVEAKRAAWVGLAHHTRPDTDNLAKPVMDELQAARVLPDDGRIAELTVRKVWCRPKDAGLVLLLEGLPAPKVGRPAGAGAQGEAPGWLSGQDAPAGA